MAWLSWIRRPPSSGTLPDLLMSGQPKSPGFGASPSGGGIHPARGRQCDRWFRPWHIGDRCLVVTGMPCQDVCGPIIHLLSSQRLYTSARMGRKVDVDDLVDAQGVADLLGLAQRNTVSLYQRRYPDMPRPVVDLGSGRCKLWLFSEISKWSSQRH